jgi:hypothetical protein
MAVNRIAASALQLTDLTWVVVVTGWRPDQTVAWTRSSAVIPGTVETIGEVLVELARRVDAVGRGSRLS